MLAGELNMTSVYEEILRPVKLPEMYRISQKFDDSCIADIPARIRETVSSVISSNEINGKTVAVGVGSRGINHIPVIVKTLIDVLKSHGIWGLPKSMLALRLGPLWKPL